MIELYSFPTPNGQKITIALEELGLNYKIIPINITRDDQFMPEFLRISPNNKIPAIIDTDGPEGRPISIFESGAILLYLAEKTGQLMPHPGHQRYPVMEWLMWQMGGAGPMLGQAHHFRQYAPEAIDYAIKRYTDEATRLYTVLETQLAQSRTATYTITGDYSIADIATFPWIAYHEMQGQDLTDYPNIQRWFEEMQKRPGVQRGMTIGGDIWANPELSDADKKGLFWRWDN